ncbi:MAG: glycosyltransferase family 4 protein [Vampirovibrio sp.]|jgi:glycosyltransferase involved in cell wall biosynthesis|nr:glycosyltransferase family 4 protein [Vampirovibrio sp.]
MKLLIITDHPDQLLSDAHYAFRHIGHELQRRGHAVDYYIGPVPPAGSGTNLNALEQSARIAAYIRQSCRIKRYDIIVAPKLTGWCLAAFRKWMLPRKTKIVSWHPGYNEPYWSEAPDSPEQPVAGSTRFMTHILRWANRQCIKKQDACFLTSTGKQKQVQQLYPTESRKALYLPNGVSSKFYHPERYEQFPSGRFNQLLFNGPWHLAESGYAHIPSAFTQALSFQPELRLSLINTVLPAEQVLQDFPEEVRSKVQVIPQADEAERVDIYQTQDILLAPHPAEGISPPVLEAMASGMAIITTPVVNHGDFIRHYENALVIPTPEPEAMAQAIRQLHNVPELCRQLGEGAYETASLYYTWRQVTDIFEEKLFQIMRNKLPLPDWMMAATRA